MKQKRKKIVTARQMDYLLARKIKASDLGRQYQHAMNEFQARQAVEAGSQARNLQIQYGKMIEAVNRLPVALRGPTMERIDEIGSRLEKLKQRYPMNFPRGPMPGANEALKRRRMVF